MTYTLVDVFMYSLMALLAGLALGGKITATRWSRNADEPQRILYSGEFYKVYHLPPSGHHWYDPGGWLTPRHNQQEAARNVRRY